jgi:hypothetical protein
MPKVGRDVNHTRSYLMTYGLPSVSEQLKILSQCQPLKLRPTAVLMYAGAEAVLKLKVHYKSNNNNNNNTTRAVDGLPAVLSDRKFSFLLPLSNCRRHGSSATRF